MLVIKASLLLPIKINEDAIVTINIMGNENIKESENL
jgi:hypothetical protein